MNKQHPIIGNYAPDFELLGTDDQVHHLGNYLKQFQAVAVVFITNTSNQVESYLQRLQKMQQEFESNGLIVVCINSQNSLLDMKELIAKNSVTFPYLRDSNQDVAVSFEVMMKPEAFLIDGEGIIRYRGQIDDHPDEEVAETGNYLRDNIEALLG
jgi:peroxiredoxin